jgi:hypothetical protein
MLSGGTAEPVFRGHGKPDAADSLDLEVQVIRLGPHLHAGRRGRRLPAQHFGSRSCAALALNRPFRFPGEP